MKKLVCTILATTLMATAVNAHPHDPCPQSNTKISNTKINILSCGKYYSYEPDFSDVIIDQFERDSGQIASLVLHGLYPLGRGQDWRYEFPYHKITLPAAGIVLDNEGETC